MAHNYYRAAPAPDCSFLTIQLGPVRQNYAGKNERLPSWPINRQSLRPMSIGGIGSFSQ